MIVFVVDGEYKFNYNGLQICVVDVDEFVEIVQVNEFDMLFVGGSFLLGMLFFDVDRFVCVGDWKIVVDMGGEYFVELDVDYYVCKFNCFEFVVVMGWIVEIEVDVVEVVEEFYVCGFEYVLVLFGVDGVFFVIDDEVFFVFVFDVEVVDMVGVGDVVMFGFFVVCEYGFLDVDVF